MMPKYKWIGKTYRDDKHKFITGETYELTAKEADRFAGKLEIINDKAKVEVKTDGNTQ